MLFGFAEMSGQIHLMENAHDLNRVRGLLEEKHVHSDERLAITGPNVFCGQAALSALTESDDCVLNHAQIALRLSRPPLLERVVSDAVQILDGGRREYALPHRADLRLQAMKASKSSGLAGPERSPASSAERNASSFASCRQ
jgi:hypothetical protein